jgi:thiol-disulfide isomerase/thioredoxin
MKKIIWILIIAVIVISVSILLINKSDDTTTKSQESQDTSAQTSQSNTPQTSDNSNSEASENSDNPTPEKSEITQETNWRSIEIKDINSNSYFKISDFKDKPVLLESFAVWCPTCTQQQKEIKKLHEDIGKEVISVSLDTDPSEEESKIKQHIENHGFDWRYAVSPSDMTQSLTDEFGLSVISAPSAPVILICPDDQIARLLERGVKSPEKLKDEIAKC